MQLSAVLLPRSLESASVEGSSASHNATSNAFTARWECGSPCDSSSSIINLVSLDYFQPKKHLCKEPPKITRTKSTTSNLVITTEAHRVLPAVAVVCCAHAELQAVPILNLWLVSPCSLSMPNSLGIAGVALPTQNRKQQQEPAACTVDLRDQGAGCYSESNPMGGRSLAVPKASAVPICENSSFATIPRWV